MSKEDVDWKSAFRSKVISGVPPDSVFYEIKISQPDWNYSWSFGGTKGFYLGTSSQVFRLDTRGFISKVYSGPVLSDRIFNLSSGEAAISFYPNP